jgi:hypothetical protein
MILEGSRSGGREDCLSTPIKSGDDPDYKNKEFAKRKTVFASSAAPRKTSRERR